MKIQTEPNTAFAKNKIAHWTNKTRGRKTFRNYLFII